jgi:hypothetical protein
VPSKLVDIIRESLGFERSVLAVLHLDCSHVGITVTLAKSQPRAL